MELFDTLPWLRGVIVGVVALGAVAILLNKERDVHRTPRARAIGVLATFFAASVLVFVGVRVIDPPPAFAEAALAPGGGAFTSPALPPSGAQLLVHGRLGANGTAQGEGRYGVRVSADGAELAVLRGKLSHTVQSRKFMRRGRTNIDVAHTEGRHVLPASAAGRAVTLEVTMLDGALVAPLSLSLVPAPTPELPILLGGLVLAFVGGVLDKSTKAAKTWIGLGVAMLVALALLLLEAPHPLTVSHLLRSVPVAAVTGGLAGALLRVLAGLLVKSRRAPPTRA